MTLTLAPTTLIVNGNTDEELFENAKKAFVEQLEKSEFPHITYSINDEDVLSIDTALPGLIVETKSGDKGIITAVNKKNINVTLTGHKNVSGPPQAFKKSFATFEEARSKRAEIMKPDWFEGDTGYIKAADAIHKIIVGKKSGQKRKVHIVDGLNQLFILTEQQMASYLKDDKSELI
ncbi:hypothetical protein [Mesobacillus zeae]|uniref:hypothetical protein n=1 Tax=Mesobacillus zeae TaxID=1917180 RepID=UPI0030081E93